VTQLDARKRARTGKALIHRQTAGSSADRCPLIGWASFRTRAGEAEPPLATADGAQHKGRRGNTVWMGAPIAPESEPLPERSRV
jgi:hypothetical protein